MENQEWVRRHIPGYAGYHDEESRHQVDRQIRALVGEALARLRERLAPAGPEAEALEALIFRCEFADQRMIRATDHGFRDEERAAEIADADRALVDVATTAPAIEPAGLAAYLSDVGARLDARSRVLTEAVAPGRH